MKSFEVRYTEKALKQISKLDRSVQKLLKSWIEKNLMGTSEPRRHGKALTGNLSGYWRYRIADYRLIAEIRDDEFIIIAVSVDHRKQIYRQHDS